MVASAPGPLLQRLNTLLHKEPIDTIFHCIFWSIVLLAGTPIAIFVLQISAVVQLVRHFWFPEERLDPKQSPDHELAVVITGCDSGIGKELALCIANSGYIVFAGCLDDDTIKQLNNVFTNLIPLKMDVTKEEDVQNVVRAVSDWLNGPNPNEQNKKKRALHALINNAGVGYAGLADWVPISDYQKCMDVNFIGLVRCCKAFLPLLKNQSIMGKYRDARILNIGSLASLVAVTPGISPYAASKFAAQAFSQCLRNEVFDFGIQVTIINPSFHATPLVHALDDATSKRWVSLTEEMRTQYGEAFYQGYRFFVVTLPNMVSWKVENVTDQVLRQLQRRRIPAQVLVGMDLRYGSIFLRMLPPWIFDMIRNDLIYFRPRPAAMLSK